MRTYVGFLFSAALLAACGGGGKAAAPAEPSVTYHRDIRPVVEQNCTGCHQQGGIGPFALTSFAELVPSQAAVVKAVADGIMPPWRALPDCHPLQGDRRLSEEDVALFKEWKGLGYPEGKAESFAARPALDGVTPPATEADLVVTMAEAYTTPLSIADNYRCFVMPYSFDRDTYATAVDVRPDQLSLVHHVQIDTFPETSRPNAEQLDAADPEPGYRCGGVPGTTTIYSWRPGGTAVQMLPGDAMLINAGTGVIIQVHYNVKGLASGDEPSPDQSSIAFWTLPEGEKPDRVIVRRWLFAPVNIKAGESHVVSSAVMPASQLNLVGTSQLEGEIVGQTPHMHALGTRLSATLKTAGTEQCLIDVPDWSFEWQQDYLFRPEAAIKLLPDDVVSVTCEWDNSPENQQEILGTKLPPRDVVFGEGTADEMCLNYSWIRFDRQAYEAAMTPATPPPATPAP